MKTPMTNEYANEMLRKALERQDEQEIEKWAFIIKSNNDWRVGVKNKIREMKNLELISLYKRSLRIR